MAVSGVWMLHQAGVKLPSRCQGRQSTDPNDWLFGCPGRLRSQVSCLHAPSDRQLTALQVALDSHPSLIQVHKGSRWDLTPHGQD